MSSHIKVVVGDITQLSVDAVVNAANTHLAGGGGVDGAIHRAAGYEQLQAACRELGGCPTGEVVVTPAFNLPATYIFHAVGPVWRGGERGEPEQLANCYRRAMSLAKERQLKSIAFPAISCGIYGYPPEQATAIAVAEVQRAAAQNPFLESVIFCCFDETMADLYRHCLRTQ